MSLMLCLLFAAAPPAPRDLLQQAHDFYRHLSSFSMRIEHQDSSGLFPGHYTQTLRWRHGGRFELRVVPPDHSRVPDYYADGRQILMIRPGNIWSSEELERLLDPAHYGHDNSQRKAVLLQAFQQFRRQLIGSKEIRDEPGGRFLPHSLRALVPGEVARDHGTG